MQSKINIDKVRKQLPHGAQTEIAKRANVTRVLVNNVLQGKSDNMAVLTVIADYLTELKQQQSKIANKLSSLID